KRRREQGSGGDVVGGNGGEDKPTNFRWRGFKDSAHDWSLARTSCASPQIRMSAKFFQASRVQPFGRATLGRSPKDLAKPYLDRKYKSVQTRQYLLGGFGVDPGHWSLNRAHTDAASGVTVAVDTVMAPEKVEEVLVTKLATAGVETLAVAALEKGGEGRTGLVL